MKNNFKKRNNNQKKKSNSPIQANNTDIFSSIMQRQRKPYFNSTLYGLDFQVPATRKLQDLSYQGSRTQNKFNPSQQCTLSLLEVSRFRSICTDTDKSFSDYSMSETNIRISNSTQKNFLTFEDDSDEEVVMFEVQ